MRDLIKDLVTFLVTMAAAAGSYVAGHYDKILAAALSGAGIAFLTWRWRKASQKQLCDTKNCPLRHDPTD